MVEDGTGDLLLFDPGTFVFYHEPFVFSVIGIIDLAFVCPAVRYCNFVLSGLKRNETGPSAYPPAFRIIDHSLFAYHYPANTCVGCVEIVHTVSRYVNEAGEFDGDVVVAVGNPPVKVCYNTGPDRIQVFKALHFLGAWLEVRVSESRNSFFRIVRRARTALIK